MNYIQVVVPDRFYCDDSPSLGFGQLEPDYGNGQEGEPGDRVARAIALTGQVPEFGNVSPEPLTPADDRESRTGRRRDGLVSGR